jgi:hypothetical protein
MRLQRITRYVVAVPHTKSAVTRLTMRRMQLQTDIRLTDRPRQQVVDRVIERKIPGHQVSMVSDGGSTRYKSVSTGC